MTEDLDPVEAEKKELKKQIYDLQNLILEIEHIKDRVKFGDIVNIDKYLPTVTTRALSQNIPDLEQIYRQELYKLAGIECKNLTKTEYIFNFLLLKKDGPVENFSVQIFNKDGQASLGKWIMPMSINMKNILAETPFDRVRSIIPFVKNCRRHIDCYAERRLQYEELKDYIADMSNFNIDTNFGYTVMTLILMSVYNKPKDSYVDLTIYLRYKSDETMPCEISVDWSLKREPSDTDERDMKMYTKVFKKYSLLESFNRIQQATNPVLSWTAEERVDSPLELNDTSESEDESFVALVKQRRKKLESRARKERLLKDRWNKRKRQTTITRRVRRENSTGAENVDSNVTQHSMNTRSSKSKEFIEKPKRQLRQSTLNLQNHRVVISKSERPKVTSPKKSELEKESPTDTIVAAKTSQKKEKKLTGILSTSKNIQKKRLIPSGTSTPIHKSIKRKALNRVQFLPMGDALSPILSSD